MAGMKTQEHRNEDLQHSRYEADLGASIDALFFRCPTLHGFAVRGAVHCVKLQQGCSAVCTPTHIPYVR